MGFAERLSSATVTSDLSVKTDVVGDADYVAALGMATANDPDRGAVADSLLRGKSMSEARRVATRMARDEARAVGVALNASELSVIGSAALNIFLSPACPKCAGRGYKAVPGTPVLSGKLCDSCKGDGKRSVNPGLRHRVIAERVLERLYKAGLGAIQAAQKKLR